MVDLMPVSQLHGNRGMIFACYIFWNENCMTGSARVLFRLKFQMMFPSLVHILSFVIDRFCLYTSLILRYIAGIYLIYLDRPLSVPVTLWTKLWRCDLLLKLKNLWRKSCKYSNLFSRHFTWRYLFVRILQKEIWNFCWLLFWKS